MAITITFPDWKDQFNSYEKLYVKERLKMAEVFTDYEASNVYDIYEGGKNGKHVYVGKEDSNPLVRNFCGSERGSWKFQLRQVGSDVKGPVVLGMEKKFSCTCCCLNRPKVTVMDYRNDTMLGEIDAPCSCCNYRLLAQNPQGQQDFKVGLAECCIKQPGVYCPMPCGPCKFVDFMVKDSTDNNIAKWTKKMPGVTCFTDAPVDSYNVEFDPRQTAEQKAMMLSTAISLDMLYFNTQQK